MSRIDTTRLVQSGQFFGALKAAGVLPDDLAVTRVVVDARAGAMVVVHVEAVGDDRLLQVTRVLRGVEIERASAPPEATA